MAIGYIDRIHEQGCSIDDGIVPINYDILIQVQFKTLSFIELSRRGLIASTMKEWGKIRARWKEHGIT